MEALNHFAYECRVCDETWPTDESRVKHEYDDHWYCEDCDRYLSNRNALQMHLNSKVHRGITITCPFCQAGYTTATGLTHHLERGACPKAPNLNRDTVYKTVRERDPQGIMSKKLIDYHGTPTYTVTEMTWNGSAYECYFCRREFGTIRALTHHLNSPAHQQALYHCPNRTCRQDFKTLAATINHLESQACRYMSFDNVGDGLDCLIRGTRRLMF